MSLRIRRPSPAMFVAIVALIVSMSGVAVAVTHSGDSLITARTLSGNRLRLNTVTGAEVNESQLATVPKANLANHVPALVWHDLTLINGWTDYWKPLSGPSPHAPGWAVDIQGIVHLRGEIANGTLYQFAVLPSGLGVRPNVGQIALAATMLDGQADAAIVIQHNGTMSAYRTVFPSPPPGDHTNLDGLTYSPK